MICRFRCPVLLLSAFLLLIAQQAGAQRMVSVAGEEVNLRSGPGTQYPAEWIVSNGYPLKVVGERGKWLEVRDFENDGGWIYRPLTASTPYFIVNAKVANLRSQPTTRSRILAKLAYGDLLKTLERKSNWVKVQREGGLRGWIARHLVWGW
ncbi:peptide-binding protein [Vineibacter terrae]|uniref:Peptide-binding protein n=1 Tax=Vineibacter terrae TaxID=2586908 RepID=A0A5C8PL35_9HYPH|nr:SH3 domain-containing protein [Vineibacter terrae]TXL74420.1 peptide-binding protein [Vineibacter terrae]